METPDDILKKQKMMEFAASPLAAVLPDLLKDCRTPIKTIIGKDEFNTLVNALTIEVETNFISQVLIHIQQIKEGKLHGKN